MLRLGLVGIGDAGKHHARAIATLVAEGLVTWTAVCARDESKIAAFIGAHAPGMLGDAQPAKFTTLQALLDAHVCDAVVLATPDGLHTDQVVAAAKAGLRVLVEKPLALSVVDGERALEAARAADVALCVGYHLRHHAAHQLLMRQLYPRVGAVRTIHVRWAWPDPGVEGWRARGEGARHWSLAALGTHGIDLALQIAGAKRNADEVCVITTPPNEIDRAAEVSLRLGDVLAHVSVSVVHRATSRVIVSGDAGELEAIGTLGARGDGELWHRAPKQGPEPLAFTPQDPYAAQLRAFVAQDRFSEDPTLLANLDALDRVPHTTPTRTS